jgi:hypothetical protein
LQPKSKSVIFMKSLFQTILVVACLSCANYAQGQDKTPPPPQKVEDIKPPTEPTIGTDNGSNTPTVITYNTGQALSPTTQNLVNSINAGVNLYTGTANVSIPICNLTADNLSLPVSLNYVAGNGVKVEDDTDGYVGQGWSLQAGGMISRMVRGLPDEDANGFSGTNNKGTDVERLLSGIMGVDDRKNYHSKVLNNEWDSEADIFYFVLPTGLSGKFVLKADGTPVTIPYQPIIIKPAIGMVATQTYWEIITQDGISYRFGMTTLSVEKTREEVYIPQKNGGVEIKTKNYTSTWYINDIVNKGEGNKVLAAFEYDVPMYIPYDIYNPNPTPIPVVRQTTRYAQHQFHEIHRTGDDCNVVGNMLTSVVTVTIKATVLSLSMLSKITTDFGSVEFNRFDMENCGIIIYPTPNTPVACLKNLIRYIFLKDKQGETRKSWNLKYGMFPDNIRAKLIAVKANDAPATELFYNENQTMPTGFSVKQDWWGYYNNNTHTSLLPSYLGAVGANRNPDENRTQTYILNKIINPLGAVTELEYENHRYYDTNIGAEKIVGGLRVKSIKNKMNDNPNAKTQVKNYIYKNETRSSGQLLMDKPFETLEKQIIIRCETSNWFLFNRQNSNFLNPIASSDFIAYNIVAEQVVGNGKTTTLFSSVLTKADESNNNYYINPQAIYEDPNGNFVPKQTNSFQWRRGLPLMVVVYDEKGNEKVIKENFYNFVEKTRVRNVKFGSSIFWGYPTYAPYSEISEEISLIRTEEKVYDQNPNQINYSVVANYLSSSANYTYTEDRQIKEVRKRLATGETLITRTRYAKDVMTGSACMQQLQQCRQQCQAPIQLNCAELCQQSYDACEQNYWSGIGSDDMSNALHTLLERKINPPVETQTWIEKAGQSLRLLSASMTTYKKFGNYIRAYQNFQLKVDAKALLDEASYVPAYIDPYNGWFRYYSQFELLETNEYSAVNGLAITNTPKNLQSSTVIYDVYKTPIAKTMNAASNQTYHTSFEDVFLGFGNFTTNTSSKTGEWAWNLATAAYNINSIGTITDQTKTYILSYWIKDATATKWQYEEFSLSYQQLMAKSITGTGLLDEIRIYPKDALMTTMTYKAMIGKTSETDANNRTVYYEYDNLHRLLYMRDEKRNILEAYQYNVTR